MEFVCGHSIRNSGCAKAENLTKKYFETGVTAKGHVFAFPLGYASLKIARGPTFSTQSLGLAAAPP